MKEKNASLNLKIPESTYRRLKLHSAMSDETISGIVTRLVMAHLKDVVIREVAPQPRSHVPTRMEECSSWLEDVLGAGTRAVHEIIDMAEEAGFSKSTLYRAKEKFDVNEFELHGRRHWQLNFPD